ncbi:uncharacterized protein LOC144005862 [Festucalex cinctus]
MKVDLLALTVCLLVMLCRGKTNETTPSPLSTSPASTKPTTPGLGLTTTTDSAPPSTVSATPDPATSEPSSSAETGSSPTDTVTPTDGTADVTGGGGGPEGLSDGAIAGITIGSIAGVAAIGGGVFGILKYTGRV